jgi:hypothetical protein
MPHELTARLIERLPPDRRGALDGELLELLDAAHEAWRAIEAAYRARGVGADGYQDEDGAWHDFRPDAAGHEQHADYLRERGVNALMMAETLIGAPFELAALEKTSPRERGEILRKAPEQAKEFIRAAIADLRRAPRALAGELEPDITVEAVQTLKTTIFAARDAALARLALSARPHVVERAPRASRPRGRRQRSRATRRGPPKAAEPSRPRPPLPSTSEAAA